MSARSRNELFDEEFLARLQRLHLIAKRISVGGPAGGRRSRRIGDGLEFADHRAYAPGDDIRFIDWPYYARMEKLLLRLFHEHSEAEVFVALDASASMAPGGSPAKFDYARRTAAALAFVAMGSLERVAIVPFAEVAGEPLRTGRGRGRIFGVLDFLAGLRPAGRTDLPAVAEQLARRYTQGGTLLVLSDLLDCADGLSDALAQLRVTGWEVTVVHVVSPADASPELDGPLLLQHAETGGRMSLAVSADVLASYRKQWRRFCDGCERTCLSRGAVYVAAETSVPFETLVLRTLRRTGVLSG